MVAFVAGAERILAILLWIAGGGIGLFACYMAVFAWLNDGPGVAARLVGSTLPFGLAFAAAGWLFHQAATSLRGPSERVWVWQLAAVIGSYLAFGIGAFLASLVD